MVLESRYRSSISEDGTNFSMSMVWVLSRARLSSSSSATGRDSSFPCFEGSGAFRNGSGPGLQRPGPPIFGSCASIQTVILKTGNRAKKTPRTNAMARGFRLRSPAGTGQWDGGRVPGWLTRERGVAEAFSAHSKWGGLLEVLALQDCRIFAANQGTP